MGSIRSLDSSGLHALFYVFVQSARRCRRYYMGIRKFTRVLKRISVTMDDVRSLFLENSLPHFYCEGKNSLILDLQCFLFKKWFFITSLKPVDSRSCSKNPQIYLVKAILFSLSQDTDASILFISAYSIHIRYKNLYIYLDR